MKTLIIVSLLLPLLGGCATTETLGTISAVKTYNETFNPRQKEYPHHFGVEPLEDIKGLVVIVDEGVAEVKTADGETQVIEEGFAININVNGTGSIVPAAAVKTLIALNSGLDIEAAIE
jgi:hypothetical protein